MELNCPDKLGVILKDARIAKGLTREKFAEIMSITPRYLMSIENENKKPSYNLLLRLIRELGISSDMIFYPEVKNKRNEIEQLINRLHLCDKYQLNVIKATLEALLSRQNKEQ